MFKNLNLFVYMPEYLFNFYVMVQTLLSYHMHYDSKFFFRLLDICHGQRREREMSLYLVFEHVHQDLASYLEKCPPPGLQQDRIKVSYWYFSVIYQL